MCFQIQALDCGFFGEEPTSRCYLPKSNPATPDHSDFRSESVKTLPPQPFAAAWLLGEVREQPEKLVPADGKDISSFTVTLIGKMGTARGDGNNSFVVSFMATIDSAYQQLLQELQAWAPRAPKMPISEPSVVTVRNMDEPQSSDAPISMTITVEGSDRADSIEPGD